LAFGLLRRKMETLFNTPLTTRWTVTAHRLLPRQGIGIHNDAPDDETETHRLIVQLNSGWQHDFGGHLLLFNSHNPIDVHRVFLPRHNTGIGLALSSRSYHAVGDVRVGERYTIVYSFWQQPQGRRAASASSRSPEAAPTDHAESVSGLDAEVPAIRHLVEFLETVGAYDLPHSGATLLSHLIGTYKILDRWRCPQHLRTAGLFHSVYGTVSFRPSLVSLEQRRRIQDMIGPRAEQLVYLYSLGTRPSLYANLDRNAAYFVEGEGGGAAVPITRECLSDLLTLDLANSLELERSTGMLFSSEAAETERQVYERSASLLPTEAVVEMRWVYAHRNSLETNLARLDADARARVEVALQEAIAREGIAAGDPLATS
jgi:hypothetical protein